MRWFKVWLGYPIPFRVRARNADDAIQKAIAKAHKRFGGGK